MKLVLALVLLTHSAMLALGATRHGPTYDEIGHLVAGMSHWQFARFDLYRVNPPLVRQFATMPLMFSGTKIDWSRYDTGPTRSEFAIASKLLEDQGAGVLDMLRVARWMCIPFSIIGACTCFCWARDLYGVRAGVCACVLWCADPNIIGHGQLITPDVGAAGIGVLSWYIFWRWLKKPTCWNATGSGIAFGVAILSKGTWMISVLLAPTIWGLWLAANRRGARNRTRAMHLVGQWTLISGFTILTINSGYFWEGSFKPLDEYEFVSRSLNAMDDDTLTGTVGNRFVGTRFAGLRVAMPENFVRGLDEQKKQFELKQWGYLRGDWRRGGWWYYYLYGGLVKLPVGTLVLAAIAALTSLLSARTRWRNELVLFGVGGGLLFLVSCQTGINSHFRYVFPALPFLFILSSRPMSLVGAVRSIAVCCTVCVVASSVFCFPHSLSYFNELVGGPRNGPDHLLGSSVDWGQDSLFVDRWIKNRDDVAAIRIGSTNISHFELMGLRAKRIPVGLTADTARTCTNDSELGPRPGWYAISIALVLGPGQEYEYFKMFEPVNFIGYSTRVYKLELDEVNCVREKCGMRPIDRWRDSAPGR